MAQEQYNFFPRFIDKPRLIGVFEMDEFMLVFGIVAGVIAASLATPQLSSLQVMTAALSLGIGSGIFYKKFKNSKPDGFTAHYFYRKGIYHPQDNKALELKYPYLKKIRIVPYGFTKELIN